MSTPATGDEVGAHVSVAGGVETAPARAAALQSRVVQIFTKQPSRWAEPELDDARVEAFARARAEHDVAWVVSHDSYLINLSTPKPQLWRRSLASFTAELRRCTRLGLEAMVTHPGNATDREMEAGIERNAEGVATALREVPGETRVLLELTCGSGTSVGGRFEHLAAILALLPDDVRPRVGVCVDTCHAYAAGYDLVDDYEGVWTEYARHLSFDDLGLFHLNDSQHPLGSNKDRHAGIGEGTLGEDPFRRIMTDDRFAQVPKVLETPKGDDEFTLDRENLAKLRGYRG
jgi:deoxyribonuclease-4